MPLFLCTRPPVRAATSKLPLKNENNNKKHLPTHAKAIYFYFLFLFCPLKN